ncbi:MAG: LPS assembly lipoprotein LptE [Planctomycetota bacterium]
MRNITLGLLITTAILSSGCASYQLGNRTLYRNDIATVSVPVFQSESLRRFLGERLTEAVIKEIELKTPYKVANGRNAHSRLTGRIIHDAKYAITENRNDELRDIELELFAEVAWQDRNGNSLLAPQRVAIPRALHRVGQAVHFVPEGGQSLTTAQQDAIERLATQIVAMMELPW